MALLGHFLPRVLKITAESCSVSFGQQTTTTATIFITAPCPGQRVCAGVLGAWIKGFPAPAMPSRVPGGSERDVCLYEDFTRAFLLCGFLKGFQEEILQNFVPLQPQGIIEPVYLLLKQNGGMER